MRLVLNGPLAPGFPSSLFVFLRSFSWKTWRHWSWILEKFLFPEKFGLTIREAFVPTLSRFYILSDGRFEKNLVLSIKKS